MSETIYALATPYGYSGVAIIRVSGVHARLCLEKICNLSDCEPRRVYFHKLVSHVSRETIDEALVTFFQAPASYTGEDVVEFQIHGSIAVIKALLQELSSLDGYRLAEPGEFTRRAFENDKMDLTQAEGVIDLIHAQTALQKSQALNQIHGSLSGIYEAWRDRLVKILAHLEADIEFPDEDDPQDAGSNIMPDIAEMIQDMNVHLSDNNRGEILREGLQVSIFGAPNAGKSSLLNALAKRDAAIVSELAGTTRDMIDVKLDLDGVPITLTDTAGLREKLENKDAHDAIEHEGIKNALDLAERTDIKILLYDGLAEEPDPITLSLTDENSLIVISKSDKEIINQYPGPTITLSSKTGHGLNELLAKLKEQAFSKIVSSEAPAITRQRHRQNIQLCLESLQRAQSAVHSGMPELMAEDLRLATRHLGRITGKVDVEDLLDVIFNDFCIGK